MIDWLMSWPWPAFGVVIMAGLLVRRQRARAACRGQPCRVGSSAKILQAKALAESSAAGRRAASFPTDLVLSRVGWQLGVASAV
jgi:hypothetical protein